MFFIGLTVFNAAAAVFYSVEGVAVSAAIHTFAACIMVALSVETFCK